MANPITPSGNRGISSFGEGEDIASAARRQDEERRIREDNTYFERTGINRPPVREYSPLVDNDRPDVAYDGDSYDEMVNRPLNGTYAEDTPTQIIDPDARPNRRNNAPRIPSTQQEAYMQREQVIQEKVVTEKIEKTKIKFKSALQGLDLNEE